MNKNQPVGTPCNSKPLDSQVDHIYKFVDTVEYVSGSIVTKSIMEKTTGMVTVSSYEAGQSRSLKLSPFDNLIQIIDGEAVIIIDDKSNTIGTGKSIIIPAHSKNRIQADKRFKMLSTVVKSGYEDVNI